MTVGFETSRVELSDSADTVLDKRNRLSLQCHEDRNYGRWIKASADRYDVWFTFSPAPLKQ
jgi:hypothetical protein